MTRWSRATKAAAWGLLVAPALILLAYIATYGVNGPTWDHLTSAEIFERWYTHQLTLEYLFRQHNEHRKAVPRLVALGLGLLTRFNNPAEMYFQWALLCATVGIVFWGFRRDTRLEPRTKALVVFLPAAWLMLSLRPYDVLLVGDGMLTYLSMIFFMAALCLLAVGRPAWGTFAGAAACGVLASYSQSNALLIWPIGAALLACELRVREPRGPALARTAAWAVIGAATMTAYFHGYKDPGNHPPARFVFDHPLLGLEYFLCVTGGSLLPDQHSAMAAGAIVVALEAFWGAVMLRAWWRDGERPSIGFWLIVLAVATQGMITLNRAGFGLVQAMSARYGAYSCFGPIGVYWCGVAFRDRLRVARPLAIATTSLLVVGYLAGSLDSLFITNDWYADKHWRAYLLYAAKYQTPEVLATVYSNPAHTLAYATILENRRLNVFADPHVRPEELTRTMDIPQFGIDTINGKPVENGQAIDVGADDTVVVRGWALDATGRLPAPAVFATLDGTTDLPGVVGMPQQVAPNRRRSMQWTGFGVSFGGFVMAPGEHTLALKIVSPDRRHFYLTDPIVRIVRK